jgi:hypothetical protein
MKIFSWFRKKEKSPAIGSTAWIEEKILRLGNQIRLAEEFSQFCAEAYKRGYRAEIFVQVDGQTAPSSIIVGEDRRTILKYLGECSEGVRLTYMEEIDFAYRQLAEA